MAEKEIINTCEMYIQSVSHKYAISRAFMFGSYAKGTNNEDSDIDIAIILKKIEDPFQIQLELMKLRRSFDIRIEPHPISEKDFNISNPFANEILTSGIEIKNNSFNHSKGLL